MGDYCNHAHIDRFLRSAEGNDCLQEIRDQLVGRKITAVEFSNETHGIATLLRLDDGESFVVYQPSLTLEAIQETYSEVLEREYYIDYPNRRPSR